MSQLRERRSYSDADPSGSAAHNQPTVPHPPDDILSPDRPATAPTTGTAPAYRPGRAMARVLRVALRETVLIGAIVVLAVWATQSFFSRYSPDKVLFPPERLAKVDGVSSRKVYMAVLGTMFDVTKGWGHYGPNGSYHGFAGRDASRAFITGNFKDDLTDDLTGLTPERLAALVDWRSFYLQHKVYKHIGRVIGRFYTADGERKAELERVEAAAAGTARTQPDASPGSPCNVQWSATGGKEVWCSPGKGFPRRMRASPGADGTVVDRCKCLEQPVYRDAAQLYDGCAPTAIRCSVTEAER